VQWLHPKINLLAMTMQPKYWQQRVIS